MDLPSVYLCVQDCRFRKPQRYVCDCATAGFAPGLKHMFHCQLFALLCSQPIEEVRYSGGDGEGGGGGDCWRSVRATE
jgi:hypothetical protein